jgi:hypothetical protein
MSFVSILKGIGHAVVGVASNPITAVVAGAIPYGGIALTLMNSIIHAEQTFTAPKSGASKSAQVTADIEASLEVARDAAAAAGKALRYDAKLLQETIDAQVAALNKMRDFKASFSFTDLPPVAG